MNEIDEFRGVYRFLSNFYRSDCVFEGAIYPTVEHAFQAAKTTDPVLRACVRASETPGAAKRLGNHLTLREDWEAIKYDVMKECVRSKFMRSRDLQIKLLATSGMKLVEGNTWGDVTWGVCRGEGKNWLGLILMEVRDELEMILDD